jgi:hypothetical protein
MPAWALPEPPVTAELPPLPPFGAEAPSGGASVALEHATPMSDTTATWSQTAGVESMSFLVERGALAVLEFYKGWAVTNLTEIRRRPYALGRPEQQGD